MKTIEVVAAIIKDSNKILATKRGYGDFINLWEFPGGKIEKGLVGGLFNIKSVASIRDIQKIADTFTSFNEGTLEDEKGFCAVVPLSEVAKQDYILTPGRYVGIADVEDDGEPFEIKMDRLTSELSGLFEKSHELEDEIRKQLKSIGFTI